MRKTCIILFGILLFESLAFGQHSSRNGIQGFNSFLGEEKASVLNSAVESLDQFLSANYSKLNSNSSRTKTFLEYISHFNKPDSSWILQTGKNLKLIESFESSGLRKEIWVYGNEEYDSKYNIHELLKPNAQDSLPEADLGELYLDLIEEEIIPISRIDSVEVAKRDKEMEDRIKNSLHPNSSGEFLYGLAKYALGDTLIQEYVDINIKENKISPAIIASAFTEQDMNFDDPFMKRIIVVEFYYWIMKWDIDRKEKK